MSLNTSLWFLCGLLALVGCNESPEPEEGDTCLSYGTPCVCDDGREECAPHSTNICPCPEGDTPADLEEALPVEATSEDSPSDNDEPSYGFDPAPYATCSAHEECVAIRRQCFTAAFRRDRRSDYMETLRGVRFRCRPPENGRWSEVSAACRNGTCAVVSAD